MRQPFSRVQVARSSRLKLSGLSCSSSSARRARGSPSVPSEVSGYLGDLARVDAKPAGSLPARKVDDTLEERGPHVELDLLRYAHAVVQELREAVAAARPRLDVELEQLAVRGPELDLARLQMPGQRRQPKRPRRG